MPRKVLRGVVASNKSDKTVVVRVERRFSDPVLRKTVRRFKKYHAHDPYNRCAEGEAVVIRECPPHSKLKQWEVVPAQKPAAGSS